MSANIWNEDAPSRDEARAEVEHELAELRAGRGTLPPWETSRAHAIVQLEIQLAQWDGPEACRAPDCRGACGCYHDEHSPDGPT